MSETTVNTTVEEVEDETVAVEYNGHTYKVYTEVLESLELYEATKQEDVTGMVHLLLGDEYNRFHANERGKSGTLRASKVFGLIEAVGKAVPNAA